MSAPPHARFCARFRKMTGSEVDVRLREPTLRCLLQEACAFPGTIGVELPSGHRVRFDSVKPEAVDAPLRDLGLEERDAVLLLYPREFSRAAARQLRAARRGATEQA